MFSELVDLCVHTAGRPDCLADMTYAANEAMREISKREEWADDTVEETIQYAPGEAHTVWNPSVGRQRFRREEFIIDQCECSPVAVRPSKRMKKFDFIYYRSGSSFVFKGGCPPLLCYYYAYQPWLRYYPVNARPATFNVETGDYGGATQAQIDLVSNWMLERHNKVVRAGTLAHFFAGKQDPRQQVHYSAFEQGITHIIRSESRRELEARG